MARWFDLSPMRPDEWGRQDAETWYTAVAYRSAYDSTVREIRNAKRDSDAMDAQLKARAQEYGLVG